MLKTHMRAHARATNFHVIYIKFLSEENTITKNETSRVNKYVLQTVLTFTK